MILTCKPSCKDGWMKLLGLFHDTKLKKKKTDPTVTPSGHVQL